MLPSLKAGMSPASDRNPLPLFLCPRPQTSQCSGNVQSSRYGVSYHWYEICNNLITPTRCKPQTVCTEVKFVGTEIFSPSEYYRNCIFNCTDCNLNQDCKLSNLFIFVLSFVKKDIVRCKAAVTVDRRLTLDVEPRCPFDRTCRLDLSQKHKKYVSNINLPTKPWSNE